MPDKPEPPPDPGQPTPNQPKDRDVYGSQWGNTGKPKSNDQPTDRPDKIKPDNNDAPQQSPTAPLTTP